MKRCITLRDATMDDARFLLDCRNDMAARKASHNVKIISFSDHSSWLKSCLNDPAYIIQVAELEEEMVGSVRAFLSNGVYLLSWVLAKQARGRGLAKEMVKLFADTIDGSIHAEVKSGNPASVKVAEFAGMTLVRELNGIMHFSRG